MTLQRLLLITFVLMSSAVATAADGADIRIEPANEPTADSSDKPANAPASAGSNVKDSEKNKPVGKAETFTPSEEISEDFAVSFPVDI